MCVLITARLRTIIFCTLYMLWFVICLFSIPFIFLRKSWAMASGKFCFALMLFMLKVICGIKVKVEGEENIPQQKNFILAAKHLSAWETFFFAYYFSIPVYIVKRSLMHIPVFGWYMERTGMIGINRKGGASVIEQISAAAFDVIERQKRTLIIFPQGTRTPIDESYTLTRYPYRRGIVAMCSRVPETKILLAAHNGVQFFGKGFFSLKKPGTIIVKFLSPIKLDKKTGEELLLEIQTKIENETNKILLNIC